MNYIIIINCSLVNTHMESLPTDIRTLMSVNKLKLNDDKAKVVALTGPRRSLDFSQLSPLNIGDESLNLSRSIQILGCDLDSHMTFKSYVINITKNCLPFQIEEYAQCSTLHQH